MPDAFYVADGDAFVSTEWTRGPWDARAQHAGPPAALIGRAFEQLDPAGFQVARFTMEILRPIPIARLHIEAKPVRTGRRVFFFPDGAFNPVVADDNGTIYLSGYTMLYQMLPKHH